MPTVSFWQNWRGTFSFYPVKNIIPLEKDSIQNYDMLMLQLMTMAQMHWKSLTAMIPGCYYAWEDTYRGEESRVKADLVMFFFFCKFTKNFTEFYTNDIFRYNSTRWCHDKQLYLFYSRTEKSQFYWSNRLVSNWNRLPQTVNNMSVYGFKRSLRMVNFIGRGNAYIF